MHVQYVIVVPFHSIQEEGIFEFEEILTIYQKGPTWAGRLSDFQKNQ